MKKLLVRMCPAPCMLLLAGGVLHAQSNPAPAGRLKTVSGTISAVLPSGMTLRGGGATVYLWVDAPDLRFSDAVRETAQHNRFRPARIDGHNVRSVVDQAFVFSLSQQ